MQLLLWKEIYYVLMGSAYTSENDPTADVGSFTTKTKLQESVWNKGKIRNRCFALMFRRWPWIVGNLWNGTVADLEASITNLHCKTSPGTPSQGKGAGGFAAVLGSWNMHDSDYFIFTCFSCLLRKLKMHSLSTGAFWERESGHPVLFSSRKTNKQTTASTCRAEKVRGKALDSKNSRSPAFQNVEERLSSSKSLMQIPEKRQQGRPAFPQPWASSLNAPHMEQKGAF